MLLLWWWGLIKLLLRGRWLLVKLLLLLLWWWRLIKLLLLRGRRLVELLLLRWGWLVVELLLLRWWLLIVKLLLLLKLLKVGDSKCHGKHKCLQHLVAFAASVAQFFLFAG